MTIEFDDHGKFYTDIIDKTPVRVTVQTSTHRIVGDIHVARDLRLKDELDRPERFIAITHAVIYSPEGQAMYRTDFLAVQRSEIVWAMPMDGSTDLSGEGAK